MAHIGQLALLAQHIVRAYSLDDLHSYAEDIGFAPCQGGRYVDLTNSEFLKHAGADWYPDHEVLVEFREIASVVLPQRYEESDVVMIVLGIDDTSEEPEFWSDRAKRWDVLFNRQLLAAPHGTDFGLRVCPEVPRPFFALQVSSPPALEHDVEYIEVEGGQPDG